MGTPGWHRTLPSISPTCAKRTQNIIAFFVFAGSFHLFCLLRLTNITERENLRETPCASMGETCNATAQCILLYHAFIPARERGDIYSEKYRQEHGSLKEYRKRLLCFGSSYCVAITRQNYFLTGFKQAGYYYKNFASREKGGKRCGQTAKTALPENTKALTHQLIRRARTGRMPWQKAQTTSGQLKLPTKAQSSATPDSP